MTPALEKRFHDLLVKDIKGETSPSEKRKLAILERMRAGPVTDSEKHRQRETPTARNTDSEKHQIAKMDCSTREMKKIMGRINRTTKGTVPPKTK